MPCSTAPPRLRQFLPLWCLLVPRSPLRSARVPYVKRVPYLRGAGVASTAADLHPPSAVQRTRVVLPRSYEGACRDTHSRRYYGSNASAERVPRGSTHV